MISLPQLTVHRFQRPNTLHYVLTLDHCAAVGHHYYPISSISSSVHDMIHCLVRRETITNDSHITTRVILRRMLTVCINWYMSRDWHPGTSKISFPCIGNVPHNLTGQSPPVHVIDISTVDGLLDLISVGNMIELSRALDDGNYTGEPMDADEEDEIDATITRYRMFMRWFARRFSVVFGKEWVNATYVFKKRLVDFAASVLLYVTEQQPHALRTFPDHELTAGAMRKHLTKHFSTHWREMLPYWRLQQGKASIFLSGPFPTMQIVERTKEKERQFAALGLTFKSEFSEAKIYLDLSSATMSSAGSRPPESSHAVAGPSKPSKRGPPSPTKSSPSSSRPTKQRR